MVLDVEVHLVELVDVARGVGRHFDFGSLGIEIEVLLNGNAFGNLHCTLLCGVEPATELVAFGHGDVLGTIGKLQGRAAFNLFLADDGLAIDVVVANGADGDELASLGVEERAVSAQIEREGSGLLAVVGPGDEVVEAGA